jgi:hypothetical protein
MLIGWDIALLRCAHKSLEFASGFGANRTIPRSGPRHSLPRTLESKILLGDVKGRIDQPSIGTAFCCSVTTVGSVRGDNPDIGPTSPKDRT